MVERDEVAGPQVVPGRVSILIPSYIRPDDLCHTLMMTLTQRYVDLEIVVVDDGTPGTSIEDAVQKFAGVHYRRIPENLGLIGARNFGADCCTGEFILNLDDDSWLEDEDGVSKIVDFMRARPDCGVAALNIGLSNQGYLWPRDAVSTRQRTYKGCGNVYRRNVLLLVGGYITQFYRQGEEVERSLRVMDAGFEILSLPAVRVFHAQSSVNRNHRKHIAFEAANYFRRELLRAPWWLMPLGIARASRWTLKHRKQMDWDLFKAEMLGDRVPLRALISEHRAPVSAKTYISALKIR